MHATLLPFLQQAQNLQRLLIVQGWTRAPLIIDSKRRVDGERLFGAETFRLDVGNEAVERRAWPGYADERRVAAKGRARREPLSRIVQELDSVLAGLIYARRMLDSREGLVLQEDRLALAAAGCAAVRGEIIQLDIE